MTNTLITGKEYLWHDPRGRETRLVWVAGLWSMPGGRAADTQSLTEQGWIAAYQSIPGQ